MSAGGDNRPAQPMAPRAGDEPGRAEQAGPTLRGARATDARRLSEIARAAKAHWGYPAAWLAGWRAGGTSSESRLKSFHAIVP